MHMRGEPKTMQDDTHYDNIFGELILHLQGAIKLAESRGVKRERIVIDPGIGFGKSWKDNLLLIKHLDHFKVLGQPILVGPSRKSFIGRVLDAPVEERLEGTAAAVAIAVFNGASVVRVHDVAPMVKVIRVADAIRSAGRP